MKIPLIQKILATFFCLLFISLVLVAGVYYTFYSNHMERLAQKNQETAFDLIFDNIGKTIAESTPAIDAFIRDSVESKMCLLNVDQDHCNFHNLSEKQLYRELPAILSRHRDLARAINQFSSGHGINKLVIYDKDLRARVVFLQEGDKKRLGVFLGMGDDARFVPFGTQQLSDLGGRLVQFLSPEELSAMLEPSLPAGINATYTGDIPDETTAGMGHFSKFATIRFLTPIMQNNTFLGLSEIEIGLRENDVARFAKYSHTQINIFAGGRLIIGSLPEYVTLDIEDPPVIFKPDFSAFRPPRIHFSEANIAGEAYSQARVAMGEDENLLVLTVNYPRGIMTRERNALLISTGSVVLIIGLFSFLLSTIISTRVNRFIQQMLNYLDRLAHGDVPQKMEGPFKGEPGAIKKNFNALITNYGETVQIAGKIADGDLSVHLKERSEQDMLSHAVNTMAENLLQARNTLEQRVMERTKQLSESEERYKQAHDELEDKVAERTADLEAANLRLQDLDKLKSMFIASMSHELRTPLNSIIGFSGLLLQGISGDLNSEQKDSLERVYRSGNHLLGLISDVIDISKIEAGRIDVFHEQFPLKDLVVESMETIRPLADAKGLKLVLHADTWPQMNTDKKRLLQCLLNYLSNAVKFTEKGTVTLTVTIIKDMVEFKVNDTGIGIAKSDLPKLFEAFERLETHLVVKAGGTGLGLYLTKKIVQDLLKGSVSVESKIGEGSLFGLCIPGKLND